MTRPLSVGIVCFPSLGGSGVVATDLAVGLAERGHRIHLVARALPRRSLPEREGLTFHPVDVPEYPLFEHPPYTVALASALVDVARAHRLDVIHVHYAVPHATSAYLARQALGAGAPRILTSLHGTDVLRVGSHPAYRSIVRFSVAQSDGVVVPSAFLRDEAMRLLELPATLPLEVIHNFVDTERFSPGAGRDLAPVRALFDGAPVGDGPLLFHVSNFRPVKRVQDALEVLARVRQELPARLVLVGDGPERAAVEARAAALGLSCQVRFLGKRNDFVEYLRLADGFVLPSETESFGLAALEALSTGVPVFGYRVGGLPELVTPEVGRLVEPFDTGALGAAIVEAVRQPEVQAKMRRAARTRASEHFRAGPAIGRYEAYLRRLVSLPERPVER